MTVQLITIITVPQSQRVKCQHPGCTRNVFSKIHVVRKNGEITFVGGRCFQKLFGDLNLEPVFGGGGGIRLSEAEREKILQNTDEFLAELQTIYEESDIEEPKTPEVTVGLSYSNHSKPGKGTPTHIHLFRCLSCSTPLINYEFESTERMCPQCRRSEDVFTLEKYPI